MDEASALLELQEQDLEILRAERALDELPEKRAILEVRAKQREVEALKHKADVLVSKLEAEARRVQDETDAVTEKIEAEQAKIMSGEIADHKQVQHISRELDALKRRKDKLEMEALQIMERIEKAAGQKDKVDDALTQLVAREASYVERFKERGGELQTRIATATKRREKLTASLNADLARSLRDASRTEGRHRCRAAGQRQLHLLPRGVAGRRGFGSPGRRRDRHVPAVPPADRRARGIRRLMAAQPGESRATVRGQCGAGPSPRDSEDRRRCQGKPGPCGSRIRPRGARRLYHRPGRTLPRRRDEQRRRVRGAHLGSRYGTQSGRFVASSCSATASSWCGR